MTDSRAAAGHGASGSLPPRVDSVLAGYKRVIAIGEQSAGAGFIQVLSLD